jgi:hypothetical protein
MEAAEPTAKVNSEDKMFISFLLNHICETRPEEMWMSIENLSKFMLTLDALDKANLYRKQYGNLKEVIKLPQILNVLFLDNNIIRFNKKERITQCADLGIISAADYEVYLETEKIFWTHKLTLLKNLKKNLCKNCNDSYKVVVNKTGLCHTTGGAHDPKYDFSKSDDVLLCQIE